MPWRRRIFGSAVALTAAATLSAHAAEGGMPQLNPANFAPQLVWLFITFVGLYLILSRVALPRVTGVLEERQSRIANDLDAAERMKGEAEKALAEYEAGLAAARTKAEGLISTTRQEAAAAAAAARSEQDAALGDQIKAAEARIAEATTAALAQREAAAGELVQAIARRLVDVEVDDTMAGAALRRALASEG